MKQVLLWLWLLAKRLLKKPTFLAILLFVPLLSFGYQAMTREDSGMLTILLTQEGNDPTASAIIQDLLEQDSVFRYQVCNSPEEAAGLVQTGKADAAWVFPEDLERHMDEFLADHTEKAGFVQVLQREQNTTLMLSRERLCGAMYRYLSQRYYLQYTREEFPSLQDLTDEELMVYYDEIEMTNQLFEYKDVNDQDVTTVHYLVAPMRGILAVVTLLCGLATALYYMKDRQKGTFDLVPDRFQALPELGCQMVSCLIMGVAVLLALVLTGLGEHLLLEIPALLLYSLCVASFCMMLRALCGNIRILGGLLPLLCVAALVLCPVFFDLSQLRLFQFLLPPTYFINCVYNPWYFLYMGLYCGICFGIYTLLQKCFHQ